MRLFWVHTSVCMHAVYLDPGVLLWWGICVKVRGRMLVFELISAHANITPTRTMPSAQFISSRLLPSRKRIRRCGRCCGCSRGRQSTPRSNQHLPSRCRPRRRALQSRLSSRPLAVVSCDNRISLHLFVSCLCMLFCLALVSLSRLGLCPFSGLVCNHLLKQLREATAI